VLAEDRDGADALVACLRFAERAGTGRRTSSPTPQSSPRHAGHVRPGQCAFSRFSTACRCPEDFRNVSYPWRAEPARRSKGEGLRPAWRAGPEVSRPSLLGALSRPASWEASPCSRRPGRRQPRGGRPARQPPQSRLASREQVEAGQTWGAGFVWKEESLFHGDEWTERHPESMQDLSSLSRNAGGLACSRPRTEPPWSESGDGNSRLPEAPARPPPGQFPSRLGREAGEGGLLPSFPSVKERRRRKQPCDPPKRGWPFVARWCRIRRCISLMPSSSPETFFVSGGHRAYCGAVRSEFRERPCLPLPDSDQDRPDMLNRDVGEAQC
jgi:hypothetical protein